MASKASLNGSPRKICCTIEQNRLFYLGTDKLGTQEAGYFPFI
jgi:hypothetical protein